MRDILEGFLMEKKDGSTTKLSQPVFYGAFLAAAGVSICKAYNLGEAMSSSWPGMARRVFQSDLAFLGCVLALGLFAGLLRKRVWRIAVLVVVFVADVAYLADTYVVVLTNHRLTIRHAITFLSDAKLVAAGITPGAVLTLLAFIALHFVRTSLPRAAIAVTGAAAALVLIAGCFLRTHASERFREYAFPPHGVALDEVAQVADRAYFNSQEMSAARDSYVFPAPMSGERRNIILISLEHFSAADSHKASGIRDWTKRLDRIAEDGIMFRNYFANYGLSEGGIIALLSGALPVPYPRSTRSLFVSFSYQDSVISRLKEQGYHTEVIVSAGRTFQLWNVYFEGMGVDVLIAAEDAVFKDAATVAFNWIHDEYLYKATLDRYDQAVASGEPVFLMADTSSTHFWIDPLGQQMTEEGSWDYADRCLADFYQALKERKFFDNGVLIITGDHRKGLPPSDAERELYGDSAICRSLLIVVGRGIPHHGVDDRFLQQSDVFAKLDMLADLDKPLSPKPVMVEVFTLNRLNFDVMGSLQVFDEAEGGRTAYKAYAYGAQFRWLGEKPPWAETVEREVQMQRAIHQYNHQVATAGTTWELDPALDTPDPDRSGVLMRTYESDAGATALALKPESYSQSKVVDSIHFKKLGSSGLELGRQTVVEFNGFIDVQQEGIYWVQLRPRFHASMAIDKEFVVSSTRETQGWDNDNLHLTRGLHRIDLRFRNVNKNARLAFEWKQPGDDKYIPVAATNFVPPRID